jgi:hypothetical protein
MPQTVVYVDKSSIRSGKLEELLVAMKRLASFVEANVPRLISYAFFLDGDRTQMTVVAIHPDSASLEFHMDTGAAEFKKFADYIDLKSIDVYGTVTDAVIERLHKKAHMLGMATVTVHEHYAGFIR